MGEFADRVVLVTGAASGIGKATAERLAAEGARLMLADRHEEAGRRVADALQARFRCTDVGVREQVEALVEECVAAYDGLDILVNNAGIGGFGRVPDVEPADWDRILAVDLSSVFYACRAAIPQLIARGGGAIVNVASISGLFGDYGLAAYTAAKGGVANLTRTLALDHAGDGIRVNAVCPGPVETGLTSHLMGDAGIVEEYRRTVPMRRMAKPEEIANAITFLASQQASYITGVNLVVDGGVTAATGQPNFTELFRARGWYEKGRRGS